MPRVRRHHVHVSCATVVAVALSSVLPSLFAHEVLVLYHAFLHDVNVIRHAFGHHKEG
jgi:hypothetical protein